jgi:hypothetical protein
MVVVLRLADSPRWVPSLQNISPEVLLLIHLPP